MANIKEIAERCGVSVATVSNVLNGKAKASDETKERILSVVRETGYQPNVMAQGLRTRRTHTIGIIAEDMDLFSTPRIIEGIMAHCEEKNYRFIHENLRLYSRWGNTWFYKEREYQSVLKPAVREMLSIKVDGIIYVAGHARVIDCFPEDLSIPAVLTYAYSREDRYPYVVIADEDGGYEMTKYLLSMGHRKIGMIGGTSDNLHTIKRINGYQRALYEARVLYNPDLVEYGDWERRSGYELAGKLIAAGVTAVFCLNDKMAGGVYDYLEEHQIRPGEDISVAGYDNQAITEYFRPSLTTMEIPLKEIGVTAARILTGTLDGQQGEEKETGEIQKQCSLIVRNSVRPPKE